MLPRMMNDKYTIEKAIGKGGMGSVYIVYDHHIQSRWAMKVISKKADHGSVAIREVEALKRLQHPKLPRVVDVLEDDENYMIIMDYIQGINLKQYLLCNGKASTKTLIDWGLQLCEVFIYLHQQEPKIYYLDLKPENIIIRQQELVLIDFGCASVDQQNEKVRYGSIGFAAPEQFDESEKLDERTDVYALGATLLHAWTLQVKEFPHCKKRLDREVNKILKTCMQKNKKDRYQTIQEVKKDLEKLIQPKKSYTVYMIVIVFLFFTVSFFINFNESKRTYLKLQDCITKWECIEQDIQDDPTSLTNYQRLFDDYRKDNCFSQEEEFHFVTHIEPMLDLKKPNAQLCYEIACLYQYYDVDMDINKQQKVRNYFKIATQSKNPTIRNEAICYVNLLSVHKNYKEYFRYMQQALKTKMHNEAQFHLYHYLLSQLITYLPSFYQDHVPKDDIHAFMKAMEGFITQSNCDKQQKDDLLKQISDLNKMNEYNK